MSWTHGLAECVLCVLICKLVAPVMLYLIFKWVVAELVLCSSLGGSGRIWGTSGLVWGMSGLCWVCGFSPNSPFPLSLAGLVAGVAGAVGEGRIKPLAGLPPPLLSPPVRGADRPMRALLYRGGLWVRDAAIAFDWYPDRFVLHRPASAMPTSCAINDKQLPRCVSLSVCGSLSWCHTGGQPSLGL